MGAQDGELGQEAFPEEETLAALCRLPESHAGQEVGRLFLSQEIALPRPLAGTSRRRCGPEVPQSQPPWLSVLPLLARALLSEAAGAQSH